MHGSLIFEDLIETCLNQFLTINTKVYVLLRISFHPKKFFSHFLRYQQLDFVSDVRWLMRGDCIGSTSCCMCGSVLLQDIIVFFLSKKVVQCFIEDWRNQMSASAICLLEFVFLLGCLSSVYRRILIYFACVTSASTCQQATMLPCFPHQRYSIEAFYFNASYWYPCVFLLSFCDSLDSTHSHLTPSNHSIRFFILLKSLSQPNESSSTRDMVFALHQSAWLREILGKPNTMRWRGRDKWAS